MSCASSLLCHLRDVTYGVVTQLRDDVVLCAYSVRCVRHRRDDNITGRWIGYRGEGLGLEEGKLEERRPESSNEEKVNICCVPDCVVRTPVATLQRGSWKAKVGDRGRIQRWDLSEKSLNIQ